MVALQLFTDDRIVLYTIGKLSASAFKHCNYFYAEVNNSCRNKHFTFGPLLL